MRKRMSEEGPGDRREINKKGYRYVVDAHPEACIACCMCAQVCPDCVIEVFK
ncbi:MAG: hypothetical protein ACLTW9_15850 [Enterocloster sp.]